MTGSRKKKSVYSPGLTDAPALSMDVAGLLRGFRHYFTHNLGRDKHCKSPDYHYLALALTVRDRLMERWRGTRYAYEERDVKRCSYLSLEFLMGRTLGNASLSLGVTENISAALHSVGLEMEDLVEAEQDAGLGNGGLGRLAACFLDSCATLQLPVVGYGIRYEYGMFRQKIEDGRQVEEPDHWLRGTNPWEIVRSEYTQTIRYGGRSEHYRDQSGNIRFRLVDTMNVLAVPYDIPVPGYLNGTVNTLRLWKSAATDAFDLGEFNAGSYPESVSTKNAAENITMVLYPNDASENGKELRLKQQYFLASASLQDIVARWTALKNGDFSHFAEKNVFQLNDTHPSCAVPELMRILMDDHGYSWDSAWDITAKIMAYTNHTLLPEALEKWPVDLFQRLLPRLLEIIYEINARFMAEVAHKWPGDVERLRRMSIVEEGNRPEIRMAYLAIVGSFSVNGVAELHSKLLAEGLFRDFYELWPQKFNNKTNGVTPRRWLAWCNPALRSLLNRSIGNGWVRSLEEISAIIPLKDDPAFCNSWREVKRKNKERLAVLVFEECGVHFSPDSMFDVQVKRIHEYKRQLLNILHVIHLYDRIKRGDTAEWTNRCILIGGKAAPGYYMAKLIIKLINNVANTINSDADVGDMLKVAFLPNYRVSAMEIICPGTDLSEQISTAGKEASGTGNMKFMMNGAVTIGTLDGANIEILEEVGEENFFVFGLTAEEVEERRRCYNPKAIIAADSDLMRVFSLLECRHFNMFEPGLFDPIINSVKSGTDPWLTAADFASYRMAQEEAAKAYRDKERWTRMSIINSARSGRFSTDRTIADYNRDIWGLEPTSAFTVK